MSSIYESKSWIQIFEKELLMIKNPKVLDIVSHTLLNLSSDRCKVAPAASTAKYHPLCSLGDGGTIRHTKFVVRNIAELIRATPALEKENDELIAAAILHDLMKYPTDDIFYSKPDHPTLMGKFIRQHNKGKYAKTIARLVEHHQGRKEWQYDRQNPSVLLNKSPKRFDEWALHYADLLASRPYMNAEFDDNGELILDSCPDRNERIKEIKIIKKQKHKESVAAREKGE